MACLCALKIQTQLFSGGTVLNEFHLLTASECSHWCDVVLLPRVTGREGPVALTSTH